MLLNKDYLQSAIQYRKKKALYKGYRTALILKIVVVIAIFVFVFTQVFGLAVISGNEMYPALHDADVVLYYRNAEYMDSDVVLYEAEGNVHAGRIEATSGAKIDKTGDNQLTIDGNFQPIQKKSGIFSKTLVKDLEPFEVEPGHYYILCDDRTRYTDSRTFGQVVKYKIKGRIIAVLRRRGL